MVFKFDPFFFEDTKERTGSVQVEHYNSRLLWAQEMDIVDYYF